MKKLTEHQIEALLLACRAAEEVEYPNLNTPQYRAARRKLQEGLTVLKAARRKETKKDVRTRRS